MGFKYEHGESGILIEISDVEGDFMSSLNHAERVTLGETIEIMLSSFVEAIKDVRQERSRDNELEG